MKTILTVKDEFGGKISEREVGFLSEFYMGSEDYRIREINRWIDQRGNQQHNTFLSLVSYRNER